MGRKSLIWIFLKLVKDSWEIENWLFRISSRARIGEGEGAWRKESNGEIMRLGTQGTYRVLFSPGRGEFLGCRV